MNIDMFNFEGNMASVPHCYCTNMRLNQNVNFTNDTVEDIIIDNGVTYVYIFI